MQQMQQMQQEPADCLGLVYEQEALANSNAG